MSEDVLSGSDSETAQLAGFASLLAFDDLPKEVVTQAKRCIMDALGCALFGSTLAWSRILAQTMAHVEQGGPAAVWGTTLGLGPGAAALVNGSAVHSFELDDLHKTAIMHPGGVTLPALLALAECPLAPRRQVSGRDLIVALVAGYEVGIRVGLAVGLGLLHRGWHNNGVLGTISAAAGAGRLLGLDANQMEHALGIAATQSGGLMGAQYGSMVKRFHAGRASQSGLYSAALAGNDYTGIANVFGDRYGMFLQTFSDEYDVAQIAVGLGKTWEIENVGFKWYPACGSSHTSIDAALQLRATPGFESNEIVRCVVHSSSATKDHVGWPYVPDTTTTAQMNLPYAVAVAFSQGEVTAKHFAEPFVRDPEILALANRISVEADPATDARGPRFRHAIAMELEMRDGSRLRTAVDHAKGSEYFPLNDEELSSKFHGLASAVLPDDQVELLERTVHKLEDLDDISQLSALLVPTSS